MYDICAFANIRRTPRTAWTVLLKTKIGEVLDYTVYELFAGVRPDGSDVFAFRQTTVTPAGGVGNQVEYADKLDALDAYNAAVGTAIDVVVA